MCSTNNGNCPELCLATPIAAVCACTEGFEFVNGSCAKQSNYTAPSRCPPNNFECTKNKRYVLHEYFI